MGGVIFEVVVPKDTTITLDKMSGFFMIDCITGSGYNAYPIVGYSSSRNNTLLLGGFYDNASFDSNGALTIRGLSGTDLRYKGILFGNKQN